MSSESVQRSLGARGRIDERVARIEKQLELLRDLLGLPGGGSRAAGSAEAGQEARAATETGGKAR